jgi:hypothetical protein
MAPALTKSIAQAKIASHGKSIPALKAQCQTLCSKLQGIIIQSHKDLLSVSTASCSNGGFANRCTV